MGYRLRSAVGSVVEAVAVSERRRLLVVFGVPLSFWLVVELAADLGFLPLVLAAGLAAYLYTRGTVQGTLAASSAGTGLLLVSLFLLQVHWLDTGGSTEPLAGAITRLSGWFLTGTPLIVLGVWLSDVEPPDE